MVSELNIIQAMCGGRPGMSGQLEGPSVFLLIPMGGAQKPILGISPSKSPHPTGYCQHLI